MPWSGSGLLQWTAGRASGGRLYGVRLIFLDMDLGFGGEAKQLIGQVITVLKKVLPDYINPLMIVVWTKHKELYDEFSQLAGQELPHLRPGVVLMMAKAEFGSDIKAIATRIVKLLADNAPLDLVYLWEQCVHDAASYTIGSLAELVGPDPQNWHTRMNALLGASSSICGKCTGTTEPSACVLL